MAPALHIAASGFAGIGSPGSPATRQAVVTTLLNAGANALALDLYGFTALQRAALVGECSVLDVLVAAGLDVTGWCTYRSDTPLTMALMSFMRHTHFGVATSLPSVIKTCQRLLSLGT